MHIQIVSRWDRSHVLWSGEADDIAHAMVLAHDVDADLSGADLSGADLSGVNLNGANLSGANLSGADLIGAHLIDTNLSGADLSDTNLSGADLSGADLSGANRIGVDLSGANMNGANLSGANLSGADLIGADLSSVNLSGANLSGANLSEAGIIAIPRIDQIHTTILRAVESGKLEMGDWHTCETTHCRAGWAVHLAGELGYALEERIGPSAAGALIYAASGANKVPNFYASNEEAIADMRECAAREAECSG